MTGLAFVDAPVPVRSDIAEAHRLTWDRLARPGCWWSGAERVAIARAIRTAPTCALCLERKQALSPLAVEGVHDAEGVLPEAAVEVVHQVVNDPGRLSRTWFEKVLASGLGEERYVETLGLVVAVVSVDAFCRGLGVPPHPLPEPLPGEPSRYRPPGARADVGWVSMIPVGAARGAEADLYPGPRAANVIRAMSLVPDAVRSLQELSAAHYVPVEKVADPRAGRALGRAEMELLAGRVSALNECFY